MTAIDDPARHYDRVTPAWRHLLGRDLHYGAFASDDQPLEEATQALTDLMAKHARLQPGERVLDVGCGTGRQAIELAQRHDVSVTGITTSQEGVRLATENAWAAGVAESVTFEARNGMDNGFEDASFDCVWILESSHLMNDKPALLRDSARVLAPGGRLVLCDVMVSRKLELKEVLAEAAAFNVLRKVFGRAFMETLGFYADQLAANGLEVEAVEDLTAATRPTFGAWRANAERWRSEVEALVGAEYWEDFVESCRVLQDFWDRDVLGYGLVAGSQAPG